MHVKIYSTLLLLLLAQAILAQSDDSIIYQKDILFEDTFSDPGLNQGWTVTGNKGFRDSGASNIKMGCYACSLPEYNTKHWNWTWVDIPDSLRNVFNRSSEVYMEMDFSFENPENGRNFSLMFDLYGVTPSCEGGKFYELMFQHEKGMLSASFFKNNNCNYSREIMSVVDKAFWTEDGDTVGVRVVNHLVIQKIGLVWSVLVNEKRLLTLNLSGMITFDKLKYGKGVFAFDNVLAYRKSLFITKGASALPDAATPRIWALCVGVNDYSGYNGGGFKSLKACIDDANSYGDFLGSISGGAVPDDQLKVLKNAKRTDIINWANKLLLKAAPNDLVVVYLSGHGQPGAFCASDDAMEYKDLNDIVRKSKAKRKLLVADVCRAATWVGLKNKSTATTRGETLPPSKVKELYYQALAESGEGVAYLLSAGPDENSWEDQGKGLFTKYLIKGLEGAARATAQSKIITVTDIHTYLNKTVPVEAGKKRDEYGRKFPQNPVLAIDGKYDENMPVSVPVKPF